MKRCTSILGVFALTACLALPARAYAMLEEDQTPATEEEIQHALDVGEIDTTRDTFDDGISAYASRNYSVTTVGGIDRYATSAKQALLAFPSSDWAIVASGAGYADSIAAAGLAGALDCPIILTAPASLPSTTLDALKTMGVKNIVLLGSETVASSQVENSLRSLVGSSGSVVRVSGADRYATQMAVYNYGKERGLWTGDTVVAACAEAFPDALSVSPISYVKKAPVIFIGADGYFPKAQEKLLNEGLSAKNFILTGSTVVTSKKAEDFLKTKGNVVRLGGADRYETSRTISEYAVNKLGFTWDGVAFASGQAPYDALGGGVLQGSCNSVMLLADEGNPRTSINLPFSSVSSMKFFGSEVIFSNAFKTRYAMAAKFQLTDIEGFKLYLDAGHGPGNSGGSWLDPGAVANGYQEYDLNRDLVSRIAQILRNDYGMSVYVNDDGGYYKYRQAEAYAQGCGALVSIHFNSGGGTGSESLIHEYNAATMSDVLQDRIHDDFVNGVGLRDRGQLTQEVAILGGDLPATLLEVAFIDNASDMRVYQSRKDTIAAAIARGIVLG